jgi:hypothetical protein
MALSPVRRQQITEVRFTRWRAQLEMAEASPIILIAVSHAEATGESPLHVFVPHWSVRESCPRIWTSYLAK